MTPEQVTVLCAFARGQESSPAHRTTTLSSPMGFAQHTAAAFVRRMSSVSMGVLDWPLAMVADLAIPVNTYGIGVVLEYRSTDWNWNVAPPAVMRTSPSVETPAGVENWID